MNPFNLLISYVIASSRATFYNVPGNQEITNMALLVGMVSENPLLSYLIIDNKAKAESEKLSSAMVVTAPTIKTIDDPTKDSIIAPSHKEISDQSKDEDKKSTDSKSKESTIKFNDEDSDLPPY